MRLPPRAAWLGCCLLLPLAAAASRPPTLDCTLHYAGASQSYQAQPSATPYQVPSVDVGGRFRFKAVLRSQPQDPTQLEQIDLYSYLDTRRQPVLVLHSRYQAPFAFAPASLTGTQQVYAGPQEREFSYHCSLLPAMP